MKFIDSVAMVGLLAAAPLAAQSTGTPPPPSPAPSPAPAGDSVGPPQLRDFNLNGAATQPVPPLTTAPTPAPAPAPAQRPSTSSAPLAAEPRTVPPPVTAAPAPAQRRPATPAPDRDPQPDAVTVDLPPASTTPVIPEPSFAPESPPQPMPEAPLAVDRSAMSWWPWLAALVALGLGAAFFWFRRQRGGRERYATDHAELGALVETPAAAPVPLPRAAPSTPVASPRAPMPAPGSAPAPQRPPQPAAAPFPNVAATATPAPVPGPPPPPAPTPLEPTPAAPISGGIVASGLKPKIEFELVPIRVETDAAEGAALTADIIVINRGSAPARDVLVEAQLINAGPQVDADVGRFFMQPAGTGERVAVIPPMGSVAITLRLQAPGAKLAPLVVEGRKLLVPMVAINAFYRWSGGEMSDSSSFLVGRGDAEGGKMAPFRLDQGARGWSGLGARLHSSGLQR